MEEIKKVLAGITSASQEIKERALKKMDGLLKPIGSLGELENIAVRICGMTGKLENTITKKCIIIMAADNGVCEEGVSACPQEITQIQTINFTRGITGVNVLSRHAGSDIRIVDVGVNGTIEDDRILSRKVALGTQNMAVGPAMTEEQMYKAIRAGMEVVEGLVMKGYDLLGTGEMGIGNTTSSSAVLMGLTGISSELAVGRGAGLSDEAFLHKKQVIERALDVNRVNPEDPFDVLRKVGGFDIAGLVGCFLAAAYHKTPVVIDGFISSAAALVAYRINPLVKDYMIASHISAEPGFTVMMKEIGLRPFLDLGMRLGEGTGCALAFSVVEASLKILNEMGSFQKEKLDDGFLVDIRS
jgi:nicotinate-nucleotide--dimethylbenzimidazole phosphoribosyltransferase